MAHSVEQLFESRSSGRWALRLRRWLSPPAPLVMNPAEPSDFPLGGLEVVASGWRTGPTATLLAVLLEYVKLLVPSRAWRMASHGVVGWLTSPLRYVDLILLRRPDAGRLGNHCYVWFRKPEPASSPATSR